MSRKPKITVTTPRLEYDKYCDDYLDGGRIWVCRCELFNIANHVLTRSSSKAVQAAPAIWLTITNRPAPDAEEVRISAPDECGDIFLTFQQFPDERISTYPVLGQFISDSLNLQAGGTFYLSLDYDDGK